MRYFDTDVLVHYFIGQDKVKHLQTIELYATASADQTFFISLLSLQELAYALAKLQLKKSKIRKAVLKWHSPELVDYDHLIFARAVELAQRLGFSNINDCLHTAIAEAHNCTDLITYNRKDFVRIQPLTSLKIIIL